MGMKLQLVTAITGSYTGIVCNAKLVTDSSSGYDFIGYKVELLGGDDADNIGTKIDDLISSSPKAKSMVTQKLIGLGLVQPGEVM